MSTVLLRFKDGRWNAEAGNNSIIAQRRVFQKEEGISRSPRPPAPAPQIKNKKVKNEKLISSVHGSGIPGPGLKRRLLV